MWINFYKKFLQFFFQKFYQLFFEFQTDQSQQASQKPAKLQMADTTIQLDSRCLQAYNNAWNRDFIRLCDRITLCNKQCRKTHYCPTTILSFITENPQMAVQIQKLEKNTILLENYRESNINNLSPDLLREIDSIVAFQKKNFIHLKRNFVNIMELHRENMLGHQALFVLFSKKNPSELMSIIYPPVKTGITAQSIIDFILHLFW